MGMHLRGSVQRWTLERIAERLGASHQQVHRLAQRD